LGLATEGTHLITIYFLSSITCEIQSQIFPIHSRLFRYLNSFNYECSMWMLFLLEFVAVLYGRLVRLYYTRGNFSLVPWAFLATLLYSYYPLWNQFEHPDAISLLLLHVIVMNLICTLFDFSWSQIWIILIEYGLKLSLEFLFGISNILILGWGTSRTYLSKRKKWKNVDCHGSM